jgi:anaerobic magnesium-protoporphyrin IX monomethyl ester cyclase
MVEVVPKSTNQRKLRVFLGNSPWSEPGRYGVRAGSRWPHLEQEGADYVPFPFFLGYATALLCREGFHGRVVDGIAEGLSEQEFLQRVAAEEPGLVVLEVSTPSACVDEAMALAIKGRLGEDVHVAFCGADARMRDPSFLGRLPQVDFLLRGEYEATLLHLAGALEAHGDLSCVQGLTWRDGEGVVRVNPPRPLTEDLDWLPWPARDQLPMMRYKDVSLGLPMPSLQMWASRGCPYGCTFCAWPQIMYESTRYRARDPVKVVDELTAVVAEYEYRSVYFDDDTFNIGKQRMLRLCRELKARGPRVPWGIMARGDTSDPETFEAMAEAGLDALKFGVESASQRIVNRCGKALDLAKLRESVGVCRRLGLRIHLTFMFGLPGETWETARETIRFALEQEPDSLQFSIVTPFPGSAYYHELDAEGKLTTRDWSLYDGYSRAVIRTDTLEAVELEALLREAQVAWKGHRLRSARRSPARFARTFLRRMGARLSE